MEDQNNQNNANNQALTIPDQRTAEMLEELAAFRRAHPELEPTPSEKRILGMGPLDDPFDSKWIMKIAGLRRITAATVKHIRRHTGLLSPCNAASCIRGAAAYETCESRIEDGGTVCGVLELVRGGYIDALMQCTWVSAPDAIMVEALADAMTERDYLTEMLNARGGYLAAVADDASTAKKMHNNLRRAARDIARLCKDLCLTPGDRARLKIDVVKGDMLTDQLLKNEVE